MAGTSLLALLDDIATVLDDVSLMTKVAAKKTAGVLGDDLALNAEQVSGVRAARELPVVWAVAKGSFRNKLILVPAALLISALLPWLITPLLMIGGAYLCYEGFEKIAHKFLHGGGDAKEHEAKLKALSDPKLDLVAFEKKKIKGAIRTDFILSAEIIVIALGSAQEASFVVQVAVVCAIALLMTVGVYGLVAGIVKMDDAGQLLLERSDGGGFRAALGRFLLGFSPYLMKFLSIAGTAAMFLVGGGILLHGIPGSHELLHHLQEGLAAVPAAGVVLAAIAPLVLNLLLGLLAGAVLVVAVTMASRLREA